LPTDNEFTRILQWPGYRVYRQKIDEHKQILELWVRRKRGNRKLECSGCGRKFTEAYDCNHRVVRDLPWSTFKTKFRSPDLVPAAFAAQGKRNEPEKFAEPAALG